MLINELLNKDIYIVPEEPPLIILDIKYSVFMANNGNDTNHTRHISRSVHFVINGDKLKLHKIDWCEGGLKLVDISTRNSWENYFSPRINYIIIRLDN